MRLRFMWTNVCKRLICMMPNITYRILSQSLQHVPAHLRHLTTESKNPSNAASHHPIGMTSEFRKQLNISLAEMS